MAAAAKTEREVGAPGARGGGGRRCLSRLAAWQLAASRHCCCLPLLRASCAARVLDDAAVVLPHRQEWAWSSSTPTQLPRCSHSLVALEQQQQQQLLLVFGGFSGAAADGSCCSRRTPML